MNRILLSLNLGSNLVGDIGASKLAEVRTHSISMMRSLNYSFFKIVVP